MAEATFLGTTTLTYTQYLDEDVTGATLVAEPLVTYKIGLADAWQLGLPPQDGLWSGPPPVLGAGGFNAIPGRMVTGDASPGYSGPDEDDAVLGDALSGPVLGTAPDVAVPVTATYLGTIARTYTQYLDADVTGTTLVAEPQGTYKITPAVQGQAGAVPGDGLWEIPGAGHLDAAGRLENAAAVLGTALDAVAAAPVTATFLGTTPLTYTQYLDLDAAGSTLVAEPGLTYDLTLADAWQLGLPPQDGLWGAAPQVSLSFDIIPGLGVPGGACPGFPGGVLGPPPVGEALTFGATIGLAVIGGMNPGFPGLAGDTSVMEDAFAPEAAREVLAGPVTRVVRGRRRKLPPPRRRRSSRRSMAGRAGVR